MVKREDSLEFEPRTKNKVSPSGIIANGYTTGILVAGRPFFFILLNVKDQRREWMARSVLIGARSVTDALVLCIAWLGSVVFISDHFDKF